MATMILESFISSMLAEQERPPLLPKVERFADRAADEFQEVLMDLAEAHLTQDEAAHREALARTHRYIAGVLTLGNLTGRKSILIDADRVAGKKVGMSNVSKVSLVDKSVRIAAEVPEVEFQEAIRDLITREPRLASSADEVAQLYATRHAFALTRVTDIRIVRRVQEEIAKGIREGLGPPDSKLKIDKILTGVEDYATAYSETVFRTNAWTSFTAGQFQQAADPEVAEVIPAFMFSAVNDRDTRPNHAAAHGLLAATTDPVWNRFAPPLGFNCRCDIITQDVVELKSNRSIDSFGRVIARIPPSMRNAYPDPGFGLGRPGHGLPVGV